MSKESSGPSREAILRAGPLGPCCCADLVLLALRKSQMVTAPTFTVRGWIGHLYETTQRWIAFIISLPDILIDKVAEICISALLWVLGTFRDLQDALLAVGLIRSYALAALEKRYFEVCADVLRKPRRSWDDLPYVTSHEARQILFHATLRTVANSGSCSEAGGIKDCILLQTGLDKTGRFQEAVGEAMAKRMKANLLVVDEALLAQIANQVLGSTLDVDQDVGLLKFILSCFLAGGKEAFVWGAIRRIAVKQKGPVALFVTDADQTICRSQERYSAFRSTFMGPDASDAVPTSPAGGAAATLVATSSQSSRRVGLPTALPARILILGGTSLGDLNVPPSTSSDEKGSVPDTTASAGEGEDFPIPPSVVAAAAAAELGFPASGNKKDDFDVRQAMGKLFSITVKLEAPRSGPGSTRHWEQLQRDSQDLLAETNRRHLASLLPSKTTIPDAACSVYRDRALSAPDWEKVLGWARFMQGVLNQEARLTQQHAQQEALPAEGIGQPLQQQPSPGTERKMRPIRRSRSASSSRGFAVPLLESLLGMSPTRALAQKAAPHPAALKTCCGAVAAPPGSPSSQAGPEVAVLSSGTQALTSPASCRQMEPCSSSAGALAASAASSTLVEGIAMGTVLPLTSAAQAAGPPKAALAKAASHSAVRLLPCPQGTALEELSERALRYGLSMARKAGGGLRPHIQASNSYEKRLLPEVVHPDESGIGFAEVGALGKAKDVLREVVQLPLQQPALFAKGSLARPTKGILLFGPPSTGKTLLAKATAAECGASFLAISPSVLMSKWVGESVRVVRACFSLAAKLAPCVLFLDEVDAMLSRRRAEGEPDYLREVKNEFMAQWDGIRGRGLAGDRVVVLGATNRPQDLDEAVLRRFQRRIFCDLPSAKCRSAILEVLLANEQLDEDVSLTRVAEKTGQFSGSDLRALCTAAAMRPVRELLEASGKSAKIAAENRRKAATRPLCLADSAAAQPEPSPSAAHSASAAEAGSLNHRCSGAAEQGHQEHAQNKEGSGVMPEPSQISSAPTCVEKRGGHEDAGTAEQEASEVQRSVSLALGSHGKEEEANGNLQCNGYHDQVNAQSPQQEAGPSSSVLPPTVSEDPQQRVKHSKDDTAEQAAVQEGQQRLMQSLIDGFDELADDHQQENAKLRPISMDDFEEALKDVVPTVSSESLVIEELKQWAGKFGEGGNRNAHNNSLTYFI